jgi:hypothetical protein
MRFLFAICALALASMGFAADARYTLDLGASAHDGSLKVEPVVTGPAGKIVSYEMQVRRDGNGNSSNNSQGGTVQLDDSGRARLASNSVSVSPSDHYVVTVRVLEQGRVVAEQSREYP